MLLFPETVPRTHVLEQQLLLGIYHVTHLRNVHRGVVEKHKNRLYFGYVGRYIRLTAPSVEWN